MFGLQAAGVPLDGCIALQTLPYTLYLLVLNPIRLFFKLVCTIFRFDVGFDIFDSIFSSIFDSIFLF